MGRGSSLLIIILLIVSGASAEFGNNRTRRKGASTTNLGCDKYEVSVKAKQGAKPNCTNEIGSALLKYLEGDFFKCIGPSAGGGSKLKLEHIGIRNDRPVRGGTQPSCHTGGQAIDIAKIGDLDMNQNKANQQKVVDCCEQSSQCQSKMMGQDKNHNDHVHICVKG